MTTGAAVSYAHLLSPQRAVASISAASDHYDDHDHYPPGDNHYPEVSLKLITKKFRRAKKQGKVKVRVTSSEELAWLALEVFKKTPKGLKKIGERKYSNRFAEAGTQTLAVPVSKLGKKPPVRLVIKAWARDGEGWYAPKAARTSGRLT